MKPQYYANGDPVKPNGNGVTWKVVATVAVTALAIRASGQADMPPTNAPGPMAAQHLPLTYWSTNIIPRGGVIGWIGPSNAVRISPLEKSAAPPQPTPFICMALNNKTPYVDNGQVTTSDGVFTVAWQTSMQYALAVHQIMGSTNLLNWETVAWVTSSAQQITLYLYPNSNYPVEFLTSTDYPTGSQTYLPHQD